VAGVGAALVAPFLLVPWLPRRVFGALPWMPTSRRRVEAALAALPPSLVGPGRRFIDLGSGDGEAVLEAARRGMTATGVELNPTLVAISRARAAYASLRAALAGAGSAAGGPPRGTATFHLGNLFSADVSAHDVIFVFGVVPLMGRIGSKLEAEAPAHAAVVSNKFPMPGWERWQVAAVDGVLVYDLGRRAAGAGGGRGELA
jgi:SAM-dependent methyltransferase